jgi:hypothetical protein
LAIADQNSQSAGIEKRLVHAGDAVDDTGNAEGVVIPPPLLSRHREAGRDAAVDVGEFIGFLGAIRDSGADKQTDIGHQLLLQVHADAGPALVSPHGGDVGGASGQRGQLDGVLEASHPASRQKSVDRQFAGLIPDDISPLEFADPLELPELRIKVGRIGSDRKVEQAAAQGPGTLVPLRRRADRISPRVRSIVERSGVDDGPVHEIGAGIMGVFVGIEDIAHADFSDGEHQPIRRLRSGELVKSGVDFLDLAAEVDGLPQECPEQTRVGIWGSDLVGLAAWESRGADRCAQSKALIDFRIDPRFGALPEPHARVQGYVCGLAADVRYETVLALVGSPKRRVILIHVGGLGVEREVVGLQRGWSLGQEVRDVGVVVSDPVVHAQPDALHGEVGLERLCCGRERHALAAKSGRQIFGFCGPVAGERNLDTGSGRPPQSPQQLRVHGPRCREAAKGKAVNLGPRHLIVSPGQPSRPIEQKMVERITDAGAGAAVMNDRLAVGHLAGQGRGDRSASSSMVAEFARC